MNEWNIQSRAHACQACGNGFADKEVYHTLLVETKHELRRSDICKACWAKEDGHPKTDPQGLVSHWQGVYHVPPAAPPEAIQKETAETLLRKLIEANDPKHGPACFILAVMLERKRMLKVKEQVKREGSRVFVYEHPKTGDIFTITDPNLQLNQLDAVQRDVGELLTHGLPESAPQPAAEPAQTVPAETAAPEETAQPAENSSSTEPSTGAEAQSGEILQSNTGAANVGEAETVPAEAAVGQPAEAQPAETSSNHESGVSSTNLSEPPPGN